MSLKANYFKLGLFVVGAVVAGVIVLVVIGSGRWFQPKVTIETYFNESVQGLDIGSKLKYRGVVIGEVKSIGFTYNKYRAGQADAAAGALRPGRGADPAEAAGRPRRRRRSDGAEEHRPRDRKGPAHAPRAAGDHRDELPRDRLRRTGAVGAARSTGARQHLHSERAVDGDDGRSTRRSTSSTRLHNVDIEQIVANFNTLLVTTNARVAAHRQQVDIGPRRHASSRRSRRRFDNLATKNLSDEGVALLAELRATNAELKKTIAKPGAAEAAGRCRRGGGARARDPRRSRMFRSPSRTCRRRSAASTGFWAAARRVSRSPSRTCARSRTTCRDLTEDSKRYPANMIFGAPPKPPESIR